jgi:hypothetical protein
MKPYVLLTSILFVVPFAWESKAIADSVAVKRRAIR